MAYLFKKRFIIIGVLFIFLFCFFFLAKQKIESQVQAQTSSLSCDYNIGSGVRTADGKGNYSSVQPGDVVCISAGARGPLTLRNFQGTASQPIRFINSGGLVKINAGGNWVGLLLENCEHFRLTGTGDSATEYGFEVYNSSGIGVNAKSKSRYFEIDHVEVHDVDGQAISSKTDEALRGIWVQYDVYVHHCYMHDVGAEGFYIGNQHYDQGIMPTLENVEIAYNVIERTGWDGGHVGSCVSNCSIHHNRVYQDSRADVAGQKSGLANGKGSVCDFYANFIKNSGRISIRIAASGANKIYNNVIVSPGDFAQSGTNDAGDGIKVIQGTDDYSDIYIWNNTIVNPKNFGVNIDSDLRGNNYAVQNNIIVNPGNLGAYGDKGYINSGSNVLTSNNLKTPNMNIVKFTNYQSDDYSLQAGSPAIDAGINLSARGIVNDYVGTPRPQGAGYDIGAYEYVSGGASPIPTPTPPPSFSLITGWNELVWPEVSNYNAQLASQDIDTDCGSNTGLIIAQKKQDWWEQYLSNYGGDNFQLQPNQSYFIKVSKDCQWTL